jgi:hypothetical protein
MAALKASRRLFIGDSLVIHVPIDIELGARLLYPLLAFRRLSGGALADLRDHVSVSTKIIMY